MLEDIEFSTSLFGISSVVGVIEFTFGGLGGESVRSVLELLLVLSKSSLLVGEGGFDFSELGSISGKLGLGLGSEVSNLDHEVIEVNLSLDLSLNIVIKESGEIDLELLEEAGHWSNIPESAKVLAVSIFVDTASASATSS